MKFFRWLKNMYKLDDNDKRDYLVSKIQNPNDLSAHIDLSSYCSSSKKRNGNKIMSNSCHIIGNGYYASY